MNNSNNMFPIRACFYMTELANAAGFFEPDIVYEGEPGKVPTGIDYGRDYETAAWMVDLMNYRLGLMPEDAHQIVVSSMRASVEAGDG